MQNSQIKHAIVTGGAKGLGLEIATSLVDSGFRVAIIDIDDEALHAAKHQHPDLETFKADLTCEQQVAKTIQQIISRFGNIHILVNNAGLIHSEPLINVLNPTQRRHSLTHWTKVISTNLDSTFITTAHVAEHMAIKRIKGVIVNISSVCAAGNAGQSAYSAAKAGINALTTAWAKELGPLGIRCAAIAPGFFETSATHSALTPTMLDYWKKQTALKKLGAPEQIADTVKFIIANEYISGKVFEIDGGLTL